MIENDYEKLAEVNDFHFGRVSILSTRGRPTRYAVHRREEALSDDKLALFTKQLAQRRTISHPNLLELLHFSVNGRRKESVTEIETSKIDKFSINNKNEKLNGNTIDVFLEYSPFKASKIRLRSIDLLYKCSWDSLSALSYLNARGFVHGDLRPEFVLYFAGQHSFKLVDKFANFMHPSAALKHYLKLGKEIFVSPKFFNEVCNKSTRDVKYNFFKNESFALGMVILRLLVGESLPFSNIYDQKFRIFNTFAFMEFLDGLQKNAKEHKEIELLKFLRTKLLCFNENERLSPPKAFLEFTLLIEEIYGSTDNIPIEEGRIELIERGDGFWDKFKNFQETKPTRRFSHDPKKINPEINSPSRSSKSQSVFKRKNNLLISIEDIEAAEMIIPDAKMTTSRKETAEGGERDTSMIPEKLLDIQNSIVISETPIPFHGSREQEKVANGCKKASKTTESIGKMLNPEEINDKMVRIESAPTFEAKESPYSERGPFSSFQPINSRIMYKSDSILEVFSLSSSGKKKRSHSSEEVNEPCEEEILSPKRTKSQQLEVKREPLKESIQKFMARREGNRESMILKAETFPAAAHRRTLESEKIFSYAFNNTVKIFPEMIERNSKDSGKNMREGSYDHKAVIYGRANTSIELQGEKRISGRLFLPQKINENDFETKENMANSHNQNSLKNSNPPMYFSKVDGYEAPLEAKGDGGYEMCITFDAKRSGESPSLIKKSFPIIRVRSHEGLSLNFEDENLVIRELDNGVKRIRKIPLKLLESAGLVVKSGGNDEKVVRNL